MATSICSGAIPQIAARFQIANQEVLVLPTSVFLMGFTIGSLVWGPSSEYFGRRRPLLIAYGGHLIFMMACAVASSYSALLAFRLLGGIMASAPIAIVGGLFADVEKDPVRRGRLMACYMAVCWVEGRLGHGLTFSVCYFRAHRWPWDVGLRGRSGLALVFLDRIHMLRRIVASTCMHARDLRADYPETASPRNPPGDWGSECHLALGARRP